MQNIFIIAATVLLGFFGFIWKSDDWLNLFIKFVLFVITVTGIILIVRMFP